MARAPRPAQIGARAGVSPSCVALPPQPVPPVWASLLDFLVQRLPKVDRATWLRRLAQGDVLDQDGQALAPLAPYRPNTRVYYYRQLDAEPALPFEELLLHQDERLVVVDKPHFLPVTPGGRYLQQSLLVRLKRRLGIESLSPIHRIDRETAGLVLFCVRPQDRAAYQALFRQRAVDKDYLALAAYAAELQQPLLRRSRLVQDTGSFFRMIEVEGEYNSETRISLLEQRSAWASYRLEPRTGKRHQLRVHMNALGLPIVGDQFYPRVLRGPDETEDFSQTLRLLAQQIAFTDPISGQARRFVSQRQLDWPAAA